MHEMSNERVVHEKLETMHQMQILKFWSWLSLQDRQYLTDQILHLDLEQFKEQQALLKQPKHETIQVEPFRDYSEMGNSEDKKRGFESIKNGKVGCLILAGGQGTRIGFAGPKGLYPISPITHKTIFQLFAEKVVAASKQAQRPLKLAIMTSPLNHVETVTAFETQNYFGLSPSQIFFFQQETLPFLDLEGNLFLEGKQKIACGPNGNGHALRSFVESKIAAQWQEDGIEYINLILIDNLLADPFDAELVGFHQRQGADVTVKCVKRRDLQEKVGLLVKQGGKTAVIEYSEMDEKEWNAKEADGSLKYQCANISLFCFSMQFVKNAAKMTLPLHHVLKDAKKLNVTTLELETVKAWKFETFIFDLLAGTDKVAALLYPRDRCFAPLKNSSGDDSPSTVQAAVTQDAKRVYKELIGEPVPSIPFELPADFYYPIDNSY